MAGVLEAVCKVLAAASKPGRSRVSPSLLRILPHRVASATPGVSGGSSQTTAGATFKADLQELQRQVVLRRMLRQLVNLASIVQRVLGTL